MIRVAAQEKPEIAPTWLRAGLGLLMLLALSGPPAARGHGQVHEFIGALTRQIARDTNNAQLYLERGELYRTDQDWKSAEADYDRANRLDARLEAVDFCRARLLVDSGQTAAARGKLDEYLAHHPEDGRAFVERGRVLARLGEAKLAVADYSRGLELLRQPDVEFFLERARLQVAEGERTAALCGLDAGVRKLGPLAALESFALELNVTLADYDGALRRVQIIIDDAPRRETWLARRGEIQALAGHDNEARQSFEASLKAVAILPRRLQENQPMLDLRARILDALKKLDLARQDAPDK